MGKRRRGRELALRCLYSLEMSPADDLEKRLEEIKEKNTLEGVKSFALALVTGVKKHQDFFDSIISRYATNWSLERVALIERNILRMALYEMSKQSDDLPLAVCIDEAIELAKVYGSDDSYRFINGILNKVKEDLEAGKIDYPQKDL